MPEDMLLELQAGAPMAESLENIEDLARAAMQHESQICLAMHGMKGSAQRFEKIWQHLVLEIAKGQTAHVHAERERLWTAFQKRLGQLKDTYAVAGWLQQRGSNQIPDLEPVAAEIAGMELFRARVLDVWQTEEDLEDLAAKDYPLTTTDLDRAGPTNRPPASFYAEESKPF